MPGTGSIAPEPSATPPPRGSTARPPPSARAGRRAGVLRRDAWTGFQRAGALGYAALAGLDLATLYLRQGRTSTLRALGAEIRLAFQSRSFAEGVRAALDDLIRVLETGSTTQDLLAEIARYITRAIQQPDPPYPRAPRTAYLGA